MSSTRWRRGVFPCWCGKQSQNNINKNPSRCDCINRNVRAHGRLWRYDDMCTVRTTTTILRDGWYAGDIGILRPERFAGDGTTHRNTDAARQSGPAGTGAARCSWTAGSAGAPNVSAAATDRTAERLLGPERIQCRRYVHSVQRDISFRRCLCYCFFFGFLRFYLQCTFYYIIFCMFTFTLSQLILNTASVWVTWFYWMVNHVNMFNRHFKAKNKT